MRDKTVGLFLLIGIAISRLVVVGLDYEYNIFNAMIGGGIFGAIFGMLGAIVYHFGLEISKKGWFYVLPSIVGFIIYSGLFFLVYFVVVFAIFQNSYPEIASILALLLSISTSGFIIARQIKKYKKSLNNTDEVIEQ